jgi:4-hydroxyphenylacetate 3-monooxygenase
VRYVTKLRFLAGLAQRMNEMTGNDANPAVQVQMGELAALVSIVDGMLHTQEVMATADQNGVMWPSKMALYSVMALQSEFNPRMIDIIRELTGAAMIRHTFRGASPRTWFSRHPARAAFARYRQLRALEREYV